MKSTTIYFFSSSHFPTAPCGSTPKLLEGTLFHQSCYVHGFQLPYMVLVFLYQALVRLLNILDFLNLRGLGTLQNNMSMFALTPAKLVVQGVHFSAQKQTFTSSPHPCAQDQLKFMTLLQETVYYSQIKMKMTNILHLVQSIWSTNLLIMYKELYGENLCQVHT